jgi:hypothetical protein
MDNQLHRHEVQIYNQQQVELLQNHKQLKEPVETTNPLSDEEWALIRRDKKHILDMLVDANIKPEDLDPQTLRDLPTWKEVTDLYGDEPRIYGLDQCQVFQEHSDRADHFVSTAGTFNSGTNLMAELLIANCHMQDRMDKFGAQNRGIRWQVVSLSIIFDSRSCTSALQRLTCYSFLYSHGGSTHRQVTKNSEQLTRP